MKTTILLTIGLAILLSGCCDGIVGTNEYGFTGDNASICRDECLNLYENHTCDVYVYEWYENSTTQDCVCSVGRCIR